MAQTLEEFVRGTPFAHEVRRLHSVEALTVFLLGFIDGCTERGPLDISQLREEPAVARLRELTGVR